MEVVDRDGGVRGDLTVRFDVRTHRMMGCIKRTIATLPVTKHPLTPLRSVIEHLEHHLLLPNGQGYFLLLIALLPEEVNFENFPLQRDRGSNQTTVPLISDSLWSALVLTCQSPELTVVVKKRPPMVCLPRCQLLPQRQSKLRRLDMPVYFPHHTSRQCLQSLCSKILNDDLHVKDSLRRGVWHHLVGVFPPRLVTKDQREMYMGNLRRVYDSLKGKWQGQREMESQVRRLHDSIQRDAVRTDPTESFYLTTKRNVWNRRRRRVGEMESSSEIEEGDANIQKLVDIMVIYTLEHAGVTYTQGMTDLLSPILYVMQHENDAYICFSAMMERIKGNFSMWCEGTLKKIERLKHLCEVLDPQLYSYLINNIEEDAFTLFFGMVLIECRREFPFQDSLHLLEVVWAAARCMEFETGGEGEGVNGSSESGWARFMTYESPDIIQQVFGEAKSPYAAIRLSSEASSFYDGEDEGEEEAGVPGSLPESSDVCTPRPTLPEDEETDPTVAVEDETILEVEVEIEVMAESDRDSNCSDGLPQDTEPVGETVANLETRDRSHSDPSLSSPGNTATRDEAIFGSHSEGELYDSMRSQSHLPHTLKQPHEMSDMSSISSETHSHTLNASSKSHDSHAVTHDAKIAPVNNDVGKSTSAAVPNGTTLSLEQPGKDHTPEVEISIGAGNSSPPHLIYRHEDSHSEHSGESVDYSRRRMPSDLQGQMQAMNGLLVDHEEHIKSRLSPVIPFFDTMEQMASAAEAASSPSHDVASLSRANSEVSLIISQLMSVERSAPHITPANSRTVPVSQCFPLFICLAILFRHRSDVMHRTLDFVGLSVMMNNNAGVQDLNQTLCFARYLLKQYRHYQSLCFGPHPIAYSQWLDCPVDSSGMTGSSTNTASPVN